MKHRNPLVVAGIPYTFLVVAYLIFQLLGITIDETAEEVPSSAILPMLIALVVTLISGGYVLYWLISTAHVLRRETGKKIPFAILLIIPLANYWWMWRYSGAAETYTQGKVQTALGFVLLALLGPIGIGILQDYYNKRITQAVTPRDT